MKSTMGDIWNFKSDTMGVFTKKVTTYYRLERCERLEPVDF